MKAKPMKMIHEPVRVLSVGRVYCDLIFSQVPRFPKLGTEVFAGGLGLSAGGGAFISAAYLTAMGFKTALASNLPRAPFYDTVSADIKALSIDSDLCQSASEDTDPQVTVALTCYQERAFLSRRNGPAIPEMQWLEESVDHTVEHLHIGELRTLLEHPQIIKFARDRNMSISLDCGWEDDFSECDISVISQVDLFLPNEMEYQALCEAGMSTMPAPITVIKCGEKGAKCLSVDGSIFSSAALVKAVDTTGAGDAFNAGFIAKWLQKEPFEECLAAGNKCGAAAVQEIGGTGGVKHILTNVMH